jgi:hypothetical protein
MDPGLSDVSVRSERSVTAVLEVEGGVQYQAQQQDRAGFLSALPNRKEVVRQVRFLYFLLFSPSEVVMDHQEHQSSCTALLAQLLMHPWPVCCVLSFVCAVHSQLVHCDK